MEEAEGRVNLQGGGDGGGGSEASTGREGWTHNTERNDTIRQNKNTRKTKGEKKIIKVIKE